MANSLEKFYSAYPGNVVLRDDKGNPSVFVRHEKVNSSFFSDILPDHPHPAFMCGENVVDDAILIGKYPGSLLTENGNVIYSLPNAVPVQDGITSVMAKVKAFGNNVAPMTIADYGFMALLQNMYGVAPKGNTYYGIDYYDRPAGGTWTKNTNYLESHVGRIYSFEGWNYKLLKAHTSSTSVRPDNSLYWERINKVGGTVCVHDYSSPAMIRTLTGSGPITWYFNNDIALEADLTGGGSQRLDCRTVSGELQIIPYNQAADPSFVYTSSAWKAIKPHMNDDGCDYVTPGTEGTIKLAKINNNWTWVARDLDDAEYSPSSAYTAHNKTLVDDSTIPITPAILYELALAPLPNTTLRGVLAVRTKKNTTYYWGHNGRVNQYENEIQDLAKIADFMDPEDLCYTRPRVRIPAESGS